MHVASMNTALKVQLKNGKTLSVVLSEGLMNNLAAISQEKSRPDFPVTYSRLGVAWQVDSCGNLELQLLGG